jgi:hypothetical protein
MQAHASPMKQTVQEFIVVNQMRQNEAAEREMVRART